MVLVVNGTRSTHFATPARIRPKSGRARRSRTESAATMNCLIFVALQRLRCFNKVKALLGSPYGEDDSVLGSVLRPPVFCQFQTRDWVFRAPYLHLGLLETLGPTPIPKAKFGYQKTTSTGQSLQQPVLKL